MRKGKFIYKYLPFSINSLKILINGELWLGMPKNLNDPFEGEFLIQECNGLPREGLIEFVYKLNPDMLNKSTIDDKLNKIKSDSRVFHNDLHSILRKNLKENYGVTSFSYLRDNVLMWAHYTDSNSGFCIMFDKAELWEKLKYPKEWMSFEDVGYINQLTVATLLIDSNSIKFSNERDILKNKLSIWKYENEVRLFTIFPNAGGSRSIKFAKNCKIGRAHV